MDSSSAEGPRDELSPLALDEAWLGRLEGLWVGPVDPTPFGPIPEFPLDFAWEGDGSLHARTDNPAGGHFDFRFHQQDGVWVLTEEGELPHGVVQRWTLHPVAQEGDLVRFTVTEMPGYLEMDVVVNDAQLVMDVRVGGTQHVLFTLARG